MAATQPMAGRAAEPPGAAQAAHARSVDRGGAVLHRRRQAQRPGPGDHPGRRRRDGVVLQPLRQQGRTVRRRRRPRCSTLHGALLDELTRVDRRPGRDVRVQLPAHRPVVPAAPAGEPVLLCNGLSLLSVRPRLGATRTARHRAPPRAGRFHVDDPSWRLAVAGGALLGLGQLLHDQPERDDAEAADDSPKTAAAVRDARRRGARDLQPAAARSRRRPTRHCRVRPHGPATGSRRN